MIFLKWKNIGEFCIFPTSKKASKILCQSKFNPIETLYFFTQKKLFWVFEKVLTILIHGKLRQSYLLIQWKYFPFSSDYTRPRCKDPMSLTPFWFLKNFGNKCSSFVHLFSYLSPTLLYFHLGVDMYTLVVSWTLRV